MIDADALLTPEEMSAADRAAIDAGTSGYELMQRAGHQVAGRAMLLKRGSEPVRILCGPGNNGGDGYVTANDLRYSGVAVELFASGEPKAGTDAARALDEWAGAVRPLSEFSPQGAALVVDALFGAGLDRELEGDVAAAIGKLENAASPILAVDLPSGLDGRTGEIRGVAAHARETVTFFRKKPGHLLLPGRERCGRVIVADIGLEETCPRSLGSGLRENTPSIWHGELPRPRSDSHKYSRGHVAVLSGAVSSTGAARMAALASQRAGAGAVSVLSEPSALLVNAAHLTSVILRRLDPEEDFAAALGERSAAAAVLGPGGGAGEALRSRVLAALSTDLPLVLDADALTSFSDDPPTLFRATRERRASALLTPHTGEFKRLFPDVVGDKVERAREAARLTGATILLKGGDSVVAEASGRAAINAHATPWLAAAGTGDVLAGVAAALLAGGMAAFEAGCAATWLHGEAGLRCGPALVPETLVEALPGVLADLLDHGPTFR